jgi:hypothetical protein
LNATTWNFSFNTLFCHYKILLSQRRASLSCSKEVVLANSPLSLFVVLTSEPPVLPGRLFSEQSIENDRDR